MNKKIFRYSEIKDKIIHAVDILTDPVRQTLSPRGGNVIYEDDHGNQHYTNDGYTIIVNTSVKDEVENAIIEILKDGSKKTNLEAGDGTSSTLLWTSVLIKEGLKLIDNGMNQMDLRDELLAFGESMNSKLSLMSKKIKSDDDIKLIAKISSNNDEKIATDIVKIIKIVGQDGQIIIDKGYTETTEIIEDAGFTVKSGVFEEELANKQFQTGMLNVPVFITDKRLYYKSEAETILKTVMDSGYNEVVIVAQDFIGEALPYFVTNHINNKVRVILIKEKKYEILEDLAIYLGGEVVSDKKGALVDNVTIDNFCMSPKVFSDPGKSILNRIKDEVNKDLDKRIKSIRGQMKKVSNKQDPEYINLGHRLSSLTTGMVTIKIGGATPKEILEKAHRYEDAVSAARCALREGYLPGGGIAMMEAYENIDSSNDLNLERLFQAVSEVNVRQIAINCNKNPDSIVENIQESKYGYGYNAVTGKIESMIDAGIIEPLIVAKQVITNAISVANVILTSRYLIVNDLSEIKENK